MTTIERAKQQMISDVRSGILPATVPDFATCHDYVDANCYGERTAGQCDHDFGAAMWADDGETLSPAFVDAANELQDTLDKWIKDGGLKECAR